MTELVAGFRGPEACAAAGISYRQLDYWARTRLVEPSVRAASGSGSQRLYSRQDVVALRLVRELLDAGMSLTVIRASLPGLLLGHPHAVQLSAYVVTRVDVASIDALVPEAPLHPAVHEVQQLAIVR